MIGGAAAEPRGTTPGPVKPAAALLLVTILGCGGAPPPAPEAGAPPSPAPALRDALADPQVQIEAASTSFYGHVPEDIIDPTASAPWTLPRTAKPALCVAEAGDGGLLATGHGGGEVRIWNARARTRAFTLTGQVGAITALAFSPDGALLASAGDDGTLRLWFLEDTLDPRTPAGRAAEPRDPQRDGLITAPTPFNPPRPLDGHSGPLRILAFSGDGSRLLSAGDDGRALVWATRRRDPPQVLAHGDALVHAALGDDGRHAVTVPVRGDPRIWEVDGGTSTALARPGRSDLAAAMFSADGRRLALIDPIGAAELWTREGDAWRFGAVIDPPAATHEVAMTVRELDAEARSRRLWSALGHALPVDEAALPGFPVATAFVWVEGERARLWLAADARPRGLPGRAPLQGVAITRRGDRVATIAVDATVRSWGGPPPPSSAP